MHISYTQTNINRAILTKFVQYQPCPQAYFSRLTCTITKETDGRRTNAREKQAWYLLQRQQCACANHYPDSGYSYTSVNCLDSSVYSCILIHLSAFSETAPWLLNRCMVFHALTEFFTQAKARRSSDAPLQQCMLYASSSTVYIRLQC